MYQARNGAICRSLNVFAEFWGYGGVYEGSKKAVGCQKGQWIYDGTAWTETGKEEDANTFSKEYENFPGNPCFEFACTGPVCDDELMVSLS